jgi:hypothetical protein
MGSRRAGHAGTDHRCPTARRRFYPVHLRPYGIPPSLEFETVTELLFEQGKVTRILNKSAEAAVFRQRVENGDVANPDGPRGSINWVTRMFTLDYDRSLPPTS